MLKEVGASGQISLGEKYAGRLFDVVIHPGDRFELIPVEAPLGQSGAPELPERSDGWMPPGGYDICPRWALDNRAALANYARLIEEEGTAAEQLQRYLADHPEALAGGNGKV